MPGKAIPVDLRPYRGEVSARFAGPVFGAALREFLSSGDAPAAEILLDGRNRVVAMSLPDAAGLSVPVVVKEFRLRGLKKAISFARKSKAAKAWRGALALTENGFLTPLPVAYIDKRRGGLIVRSLFIAERVSGGREIRDLFRESSEADLRILLGRLAPLLRRFHDAGLVHRDLSDGNILVLSAPRGVQELSFLDTNRVRRRKRVGSFGRARGLVRLGVPGNFQPDFLKMYAGAPAGPDAPPLGRLFAFWYRLGKRTFSRWIRIKKALRLGKIARALRIQ